jgi:hypothetical protein
VIEDNDTPADDTDTPVISIHALTGIRPHTGHTMQLYVIINNTRFTALVDSGSTYNFVDLNTTEHIGLKFGSRAGLRVTVANDERVHSPDCCKDLPITIGDEPITLDCFGLALDSYEMMLGVQCLESLWPILWDFTAHTIIFVRNGHRVCWQATELTGGAPPLMSINGKVQEDLLCHFDGVFATLVGCRPTTKSGSCWVRHQWPCSHTATHTYRRRSWSCGVPTCFTRG